MSGAIDFVCSDILLSELTCWVMRRIWEHQKSRKVKIWFTAADYGAEYRDLRGCYGCYVGNWIQERCIWLYLVFMDIHKCNKCLFMKGILNIKLLLCLAPALEAWGCIFLCAHRLALMSPPAVYVAPRWLPHWAKWGALRWVLSTCMGWCLFTCSSEFNW